MNKIEKDLLNTLLIIGVKHLKRVGDTHFYLYKQLNGEYSELTFDGLKKMDLDSLYTIRTEGTDIQLVTF